VCVVVCVRVRERWQSGMGREGIEGLSEVGRFVVHVREI